MNTVLVKIARQDTTFYADTRTDFESVRVLCQILNTVFEMKVSVPEVKLTKGGKALDEDTYYAELRDLLLFLVKFYNMKVCSNAPEIHETILGTVKGLSLKDSNDRSLEAWVEEISF